MLRVRRFILRIFTGLAGSLLLLFAALQTGEGQRALFSLVASVASGDDRTVRFDGPSGFFPTDLRFTRIEIGDGTGLWLTAEDAHIRWSFLALLDGHLVIHNVHAARALLERTPHAPPRPASAEGASPPPDRCCP
ncbi:hypothetical protein FHP25_08545 [Vineibacter terrae]|uniref:Uncharacterized protein n=1 Tax=Vineibacter terrae TaxID=2586908 RepID=A0A5C8PRQ5_9HYPH|nr:hypothetical protein [Vineibacter terrae]TXL78233.1 hypothetical protein FHP25_08545 [Vineibacter terrae]